jgi:ABC-type multidrug transport system permease subunit
MVLILSAIIFTSIGMVIAAFSNSESTAILLSLLIVIPMVFLSGIFVPIEKLPIGIAQVTPFLPSTLSTIILENAIFYVQGQKFILPIGILCIYAAASMLISYIVIKRRTAF